jgi:hypothetical protein
VNPAEDSTRPAEPSRLFRRHGAKLIASIAVAALFAWILHRGALPLVPDREAFANVRWGGVVGYVLVWSTVHFVRAARWHWLLAPVHPMPLRNVLAVGFIGFAAILVMPFRSGEVVRPMLIRRSGRMSAWAATGTVGAERVIDGLSLSVILFAALQVAQALDPLPNRIGNLPVPAAAVPAAATAALVLFAAAFAIMAAFYLFRERARRAVMASFGVLSERAARWFADKVEQLALGLRFLPRPRYTIPFLVATQVYWLLNALGVWLLAWSCGVDGITFAQACVLLGVLALGILPPSAPGFFGAFQISIYAGFAMFFPTDVVVGPGAVYVFLLYVIQVVTTLVTGGAALLLERVGLRQALAVSEP